MPATATAPVSFIATARHSRALTVSLRYAHFLDGHLRVFSSSRLIPARFPLLRRLDHALPDRVLPEVGEVHLANVIAEVVEEREDLRHVRHSQLTAPFIPPLGGCTGITVQ